MNKIDFSKLTAEWLTTNFQEITDDIMNGDYIEDVKFQTNIGSDYIRESNSIREYEDGIKITFRVWFNNWGEFMTEKRHSYLTITNDGNITIRLPEAIEYSGIETELEERIKDLLGLNQKEEVKETKPNTRIQELYQIIQDAQDELKQIRETCPHNNYKLGNWMWAPGHINEGYICEDCGDFLGEMKTAKEWIENPRYNTVPYDNTKKKLLEKEYDDTLLSWKQFEQLTNLN